VAACGVLGVILWKILSPQSYYNKDDLHIPTYTFNGHPITDKGHLDPSGYVIDTFNCAVWAFLNTSTFEECILAAVNLGGDADTIGAVAGQLAGAYYGIAGIPEKWIDHLKRKTLIARIVKDLYDIA
jgi:hypothetical protein